MKAKERSSRAVLAWAMMAAASLLGAEVTTAGNWKVSFDGKTSQLRLENAARRVAVDGRLAFTSADPGWRGV